MSKRWVLGMSVCVVLAAAVLAAVGLRSGPPEVPLPDLAQANPAAARAVERHRENVLEHPRSAEAWSSLGKVLMAHEWNAEALTCFQEAAKYAPEDGRWRKDRPDRLIPSPARGLRRSHPLP